MKLSVSSSQTIITDTVRMGQRTPESSRVRPFIPNTTIGKSYISVDDDGAPITPKHSIWDAVKRIHKVIGDKEQVPVDLLVPACREMTAPPVYKSVIDKLPPAHDLLNARIAKLARDVLSDFRFHDFVTEDMDEGGDKDKAFQEFVAECDFYKFALAEVAAAKKKHKHLTDDMCYLIVSATPDYVNFAMFDLDSDKLAKEVNLERPRLTDFKTKEIVIKADDKNDTVEGFGIKSLKSPFDYEKFQKADRVFQRKLMLARVARGKTAFSEMLEHVASSKDLTRHIVVYALKSTIGMFLQATRSNWLYSNGKDGTLSTSGFMSYNGATEHRIADTIFGDLESTFDLCKNAVKICTVLGDITQPRPYASADVSMGGLLSEAISNLRLGSLWLTPASSALAFMETVLRFFIV